MNFDSNVSLGEHLHQLEKTVTEKTKEYNKLLGKLENGKIHDLGKAIKLAVYYGFNERPALEAYEKGSELLKAENRLIELGYRDTGPNLSGYPYIKPKKEAFNPDVDLGEYSNILGFD